MPNNPDIHSMYKESMAPKGVYENAEDTVDHDSICRWLNKQLGAEAITKYVSLTTMGVSPRLALLVVITLAGCSNLVELREIPLPEETGCEGDLLNSNIGQECTAENEDCDRVGTYQCNEETGEVKCTDEDGIPVVSVEICNGRDDDCNGMVDEFWPELGDECLGGYEIGEINCLASGTVQCSESGESVFCEAPASDLPKICDVDRDDIVDNFEEHFSSLDGESYVSRNLVSQCEEEDLCLSNEQLPVAVSEIGDDVEGTMRLDFGTDKVSLLSDDDYGILCLTYIAISDPVVACGNFAEGDVPAADAPACIVLNEDGEVIHGLGVYPEQVGVGTNNDCDDLLKPDASERIRIKLTP